MLTERTKLLLRIRFEQEICKIISDTFYSSGLDKALFLMKEAPAILSDLIKRYENEFERVLLSEQQGNGN